MRIGSMLVALVVAQLTLSATGAAQRQPRTAAVPKGAILFRVTDTASAPVAEAEIVLPALGVSVSTSARGEVLLTDVPAGTYIVQARSPGYRAEWLSFRVAGDTVGAIFTLGPAGTMLDTVHVREEALGRLAEFDHRRRTSPYGRFRTHEEIERLGRVDLPSALRDIQGVVVSHGMGGTRVKKSITTVSACAGDMLIFLDGVLMSAGARTQQRLPMQGATSSNKMPNTPPPSTPTVPSEPPPSSGSGGSGSGSTKPMPTRRAVGQSTGYISPPPPATSASLGASFDVSTVPLAIVASVEVYTGVSIPPQFQVPGAAECGVLAIWTNPR